MARLWLDEMISPRVAAGLRQRGVDARAAVEAQAIRSLSDEDQLALAADEGRAVVTYNIDDFADLAARWFEAGRSHAGIVLIHPDTIREGDIGALVTALERLVARNPAEDSLVDQVVFLSRPSTV